MPYYVYILESEKDGRLYTGSTGNLKDRIKRHNEGRERSTKNRTPLKLVYFEEFDSRAEAVKSERYLKSLEGGVQKRELIESFPSEKLKPFNDN